MRTYKPVKDRQAERQAIDVLNNPQSSERQRQRAFKVLEEVRERHERRKHAQKAELPKPERPTVTPQSPQESQPAAPRNPQPALCAYCRQCLSTGEYNGRPACPTCLLKAPNTDLTVCRCGCVAAEIRDGEPICAVCRATKDKPVVEPEGQPPTVEQLIDTVYHAPWERSGLPPDLDLDKAAAVQRYYDSQRNAVDHSPVESYTFSEAEGKSVLREDGSTGKSERQQREEAASPKPTPWLKRLPDWWTGRKQ